MASSSTVKNTSLVAVFLTLIIVPSFGNRSLEQKTTSAIQKVCNHFDKDELAAAECIKAFKSDPRSAKADFRGLAGISTDLAISKAQQIQQLFAHPGENATRGPHIYNYKACFDTFGVVLSHLNIAKIYCGSGSYQEVLNAVNDAQTNAQYCMEPLIRDVTLFVYRCDMVRYSVSQII